MVVGTEGGAVRCLMSGLSAVEAEVLFVGELLGCFIEARDAKVCVCLGGRWGRGRERNNKGAGKANSGSVCARGFRFARVGLIELDQVLFNPGCAFDELGQCGSRPEVEELGRERSGELVAKFGDGRTGVLIAAKLDVELVPLGQERVNSVVGLHGETFDGGQRSPVLVQVLEAVVKQEEG